MATICCKRDSLKLQGDSPSAAHTTWEESLGGLAAGHGALHPVTLHELHWPAASLSATVRHFELALLQPKQVMECSTFIQHIVPNDMLLQEVAQVMGSAKR